jgi:hypothetical protein
VTINHKKCIFGIADLSLRKEHFYMADNSKSFIRIRLVVLAISLIMACWATLYNRNSASALEMPFGGSVLSNEKIRTKILGILSENYGKGSMQSSKSAVMLRMDNRKQNQTSGVLRLEAAAAYDEDLRVATMTEKIRVELRRLEKHTPPSLLPALRKVTHILRHADETAALEARSLLSRLAGRIANYSSADGTDACFGSACNETTQSRAEDRHYTWPGKMGKPDENVFDHIPSDLYTGVFICCSCARGSLKHFTCDHPPS